jgi:DNA helicase-2/ATP-dependent DNA helicase PcrA
MRNILNFQKDYPEALVIKLEQNYRSTKYIISAANEVIKNNKTALDKTLFTDNEQGEKIMLIDAPDDRLESKTIAKIIKEKEGEYSDNLILYRTNGQSRSIEEALMMEGIPYKVIGGLKFYDRMEVKDMLSYLRAIHNPNDVVAIKRIINTPSRKIGATTLQKLDQYRQEF